MKKFPLVIGHRGAKAYAPENTISSFKLALAKGVDMAEFDIQKTKDEKLVVLHDKTIDRTTNGKGAVKNLTLKKIQSYVAKKKEKIPTLQQVINLLKGKCKMNIEIKAGHLEHELATIIKKNHVEKDVLVSSFIHESLIKIKRILPNIRIAPIFEPKEKIRSFYLYDGKKPIRPYSINVAKNHATKKLIDELHRRNVKLFVYTINKKEEMRSLIRKGVDGIFTNKPDVLRNLKKQR